jgi:hypothetical protein
MAKAAFNKKRALFTGKMDWELRKKIVKCYIWSVALYGVETGTVWGMDQKNLESFEMWCWRRSVGPIMREIKKYYVYLESRSTEISYMK